MTRRLLVAFGVLLTFAVPTYAQNGSISGTVVDESGAVVPGATVTMTGPIVRQTTSGPGGEYRFANLPGGTYQINVVLSGFAPATRDNVVVGNAEVTVPAVTLALAGI